jgi:hypothetical protein
MTIYAMLSHSSQPFPAVHRNHPHTTTTITPIHATTIPIAAARRGVIE